MNGDGTLTKREMLAAEEFTPEEVNNEHHYLPTKSKLPMSSLSIGCHPNPIIALFVRSLLCHKNTASFNTFVCACKSVIYVYCCFYVIFIYLQHIYKIYTNMQFDVKKKIDRDNRYYSATSEIDYSSRNH